MALHGANDTPYGSLDERKAFVRRHTVLVVVPFVPEISLFSATDVTPLWRATQDWLGTFGLEVPFWCVPWAGGQALARWVLDHPASVRGKRVVDFGTGSGLVAIACARAGASSVRAIDVDPLAEAACLLNAEANDVAFEVLCADVVDTALDTDVLLASSGVRVLTGDPGRAYVPGHLHELARYDVPTCGDLESTTVRVSRVLELRSS